MKEMAEINNAIFIYLFIYFLTHKKQLLLIKGP
jgi:hypothetical protein